VVARHPRAQRNAGQYVPPPEQRGDRPRRRPLPELLDALAQWGPDAAEFGVRLREHKRFPAVQIGRLLALRSDWALPDILASIEHAARYHAWDAESVRRILAARFSPLTTADHIADAARAHIREAMQQSPVHQRDLQSVARLLAGPASDHDAPGEPDDDDPPTR